MSKETTKNKKPEKIEVIQSEEEKAKDIWQVEEVVAAPVAIDVVSDTRIRPEYNVKYQQYVGTEDAFLQASTILKLGTYLFSCSSSCTKYHLFELLYFYI